MRAAPANTLAPRQSPVMVPIAGQIRGNLWRSPSHHRLLAVRSHLTWYYWNSTITLSGYCMAENSTGMNGSSSVDTAAKSKIRIVVADDHPIFRDGLCRLLA